MRSRAVARKAAAVAFICAVGSAGPVVAQESLYPVAGASRTGDGPDAFVFQCLMGAASESGQLLGYEDVASRLTSGAMIRWFDLGGEQGTGPSHAATPLDVPCDYAYTLDAMLPVDSEGDYVGLAGDFPAMPSVLGQHGADSETYRTAAADYLRSLGHQADDVTLTQVIRTDLEGDGVDEVLITIKHDADGIDSTTDAGDYAAILLRRVVDGAVETVVVDGEFHAERQDFAAPLTFNVVAVVDLNGDGRMEIVATADYYEGSSFAAYQVENGEPQLVMTCGCGV